MLRCCLSHRWPMAKTRLLLYTATVPGGVMTDLLFQTDSYCKEFDATVVGV